MAIIKCPHCGENTPGVSSNSSRCINCGNDINSPPTNPQIFKDSESNKMNTSDNPFLKKVTYEMKPAFIIGIVLALIMIGVGIFFPVPKKYIYVPSNSYSKTTWIENEGHEYVGGDAYNFQMEASLKAGWISGVMAFKAIFIVGGVILFVLVICLHSKDVETRMQTNVLLELFKDE